MNRIRTGSAVPAFTIAFAALIFGCGPKSEEKKEQVNDQKQEKLTEAKTSLPDVGKLELVAVSASGSGVAPTAAVNDALKSAIGQVNGASISSETLQANFGLQLDTKSNSTAEMSVQRTDKPGNPESVSAKGAASGASSDSIKGQAFAEQIVQRSKGTIAEFKILSTEGPNSGGLYEVRIEAKIARFKGPADSEKVRVVIAPLRSKSDGFSFAGERIAASEVTANLRRRIIDALSQTGRFTVLEREFAADIQGELNLIASGQTPSADIAKLGQALSADLIWIGVVNDFSYDKHIRKLESSDRELVSFTGGWSLSQRLINVATKQIALSTTLEGKAPSVAPTTLGTSMDKRGTLQSMESDIIKQTTEAILLRTFPISVVELDGTTVVLSQGGKALSSQARYRMYHLGKELKDPQTGQALGRIEKYCCDVLIERVTPNMSYGTLQNVKISLDGVKPDALQIREASSVSIAKPAEDRGSVEEKPKAAGKTERRVRQAEGGENNDIGKGAIKNKDW